MATRITLTATHGDIQGREFVLAGPTTCQVGRSENCALQLPGSDLSASRHHCVLEIDGPRVQVRDLGSRNGTYVNGKLIGCRQRELWIEELAAEERPPCPLAAGDELQVGLNVFRVSVAQEAGADDHDAAAESTHHQPENEMHAVGCCAGFPGY